MASDLVLGFYNYPDPKLTSDKGGIEIFIKTLRRYNTDCNIIIFMDTITHEIKTLTDHYNVDVYLGYTGDFMYSRFIFYYDMILNKTYDKILLCDINDVIFQSDPFLIQLDKSGLYLAEEINSFDDIDNSSTKLNINWINDVSNYIKVNWENYNGKRVVCAGTILGTSNSITNYLAWYKDIQTKSNLTLNDQGLLNVYKNDILKIASTNIYDSNILTLDKFDEFKKQDISFYNSNDSKFINSKGKCYHIIHQLYNLNSELFKYVQLISKLSIY